jgi:hypothetical protein
MTGSAHMTSLLVLWILVIAFEAKTSQRESQQSDVKLWNLCPTPLAWIGTM